MKAAHASRPDLISRARTATMLLSPGAIGFDGGREIAWSMPRASSSSLIRWQKTQTPTTTSTL